MSLLEYENRVLYSLLMPALRFAHRCRIPLDRVTDMATVGYLGDLKRLGHTLREAAGVLGKSLRTVAGISSRMREDFFAPEEEHGLPRRVEFQLSMGPLTVAELMSALGSGTRGAAAVCSREALEAALLVLLEEGRARRTRDDEGRDVYELSSRYATLYGPGLERRIDGLNHLGEAVLDTVIARFFEENSETAFARTFTFGATEEGVARLRAEVYDILRLRAGDLEDEAAELGISDQRYHVVFCLAPVSQDSRITGPRKKTRGGGGQ